MITEEKESPPLSDFTINKDTRRSWYVCLGSVLIYGLCLGLINNFGVFFVSLLEEYGETKRKTAWVGSLQLILFYLGSFVVTNFIQSFGFRRVAFLGTVLFCLSFLLSSFAHEIWVLYLTYGLLSGIGASLMFTSSITVLPFVFEKRLATASGIVMAGNSVFTMCLGPMNEYLLREYGLRTTLRILTLWIVPIMLGCALLPSKHQIVAFGEQKSATKKLLSALARLLKHKAFVLWAFVMCLVYLGIYIPVVHLISFSKDIGIPTNISVYSISCIFSFDAIGKLVSGKIVDYFNLDVFKINTLAILLLAVSITLLPLIRNVYQLFLFSAMSGFGSGVQALCVLVVSPLVCCPDEAKYATTLIFTIVSIPGGVGPSLAAWIYDVTQSYELAFLISGGVFALAACLSIFLPVIQETWRSRYSKKEVVHFKELSEPLVGDDTTTNNNINRETIL